MPVLSPAELEEIAKRNLHTEDTTIAKFNAAGRYAASPGVGAPGSTPATDMTNLRVASAMERADLSNRTVVEPEATQPKGGLDIDLVQQRRNQILQGIDPDKPALYPEPRRRAELQTELRTLTSIAHEHSLTSAKQAHEDFKRDRDIQTNTQFVNVLNGLRNSKTKLGTPEHAKEVMGLITENPLILSTAAGRNILKTYGKVDEAAEKLSLVAPAGMKLETVSRDAEGKERATFKPEDMAEELQKGYGITPGVLQNPIDVRVGRVTDEGFKGDPKGDIVTFKNPKTGDSIRMSKEEYLKFGGKLAPDAMPEAKTDQFDTEESARTAGHKKGDIVLMLNPKTGKYQKARLD